MSKRDEIIIQDPSLVVLVGASGAGKSTFAARHFLPTEVVSSDWARGMVSDDETSQEATTKAFELVHYIAKLRLDGLKLVVIDATNVQRAARASLVRVAREHDLRPVAIVLDVPESVCLERTEARADRPGVTRRVIAAHARGARSSVKSLRREGFRATHVLRGVEAIDRATVRRVPLYTDRRDDAGPFDIVGDVHGCYDELVALAGALGYGVESTGADPWSAPSYGLAIRAPEGRRLFFVGDLCDRGPRNLDVLRFVMSARASGAAECVPGNHDAKLERWLGGKNVTRSHGIDLTIAEFEERAPDSFKREVAAFLRGLVSHAVLDGGALCIAHAGLVERYQRRSSGRARSFALYGDVSGERDEYGLPIRNDWAAEYRGDALVVYGHTAFLGEPRVRNNTVCIDTACVFGGALTAWRYPEGEVVRVEAERAWSEPGRPLPRQAAGVDGDVLDLGELLGRRHVETRWAGRVTIREEQTMAALEIVSRFGVDPRWLVYLPPTVSPSSTSDRPGWLEHIEDALADYRRAGVERVVSQTKHMGSRAVAVVCRSGEVAVERFGLERAAPGVVYTRTGRPFFRDPALESSLLEALAAAAERAGLWDELEADWMALDAELMPWSFKASELIERQYAAVGAAARVGLGAAHAALEAARDRGVPCDELASRWAARRVDADRFERAWRGYNWSTDGLDGVRFAPFHLLAAGSQTFFGRSHLWHAEKLGALVEADAVGLLFATEQHTVAFDDAEACAALAARWEQVCAEGGEGFVVKPASFTARGAKGRLVQPAIKSRGRDYLRMIYGPSYLEDQNLVRLRKRGLGRKRSLAVREFALGAEALERFAAGEPLRRVHECALSVLALESEPVDPRL